MSIDFSSSISESESGVVDPVELSRGEFASVRPSEGMCSCNAGFLLKSLMVHVYL